MQFVPNFIDNHQFVLELCITTAAGGTRSHDVECFDSMAWNIHHSMAAGMQSHSVQSAILHLKYFLFLYSLEIHYIDRHFKNQNNV